MRIRSEAEIKAIDSSIQVISEDAWDFFNVSEEDKNYEYFNDIQDKTIRKKMGASIPIGLYITSILGILFLVLVVIVCVGIIFSSRNDADYVRLQQLQAGLTTQVEEQLTGASVSSDDLIECSLGLQEYFRNCLDPVTNKAVINSMCAEGKSNIVECVEDNFSQRASMYDEYDCIYRTLLQQLAFVEGVTVSQAVYTEDGDIDCVARLQWVSGEDLCSWCLRNQVSLAKFATKNGTSRALALRFFLINVTNKASFNTSVDYVRFRIKKDGGNYYIDDSAFSKHCVDAYEKYIKQAIGVMGDGQF